MDSKNKFPSKHTKASFSVPKEILYMYRDLEKPIRKDPTVKQRKLNYLEEIAGLDPDTIRNIEQNLRLDFVYEKEESGNVCLANSPEVRDDFKNSFNGRDLLHYSYAILHAPGFVEKFPDLSKIDFLPVPTPDDQNRFWILVGLGSQLRQLHLTESSSIKKNSNESDKILKKLSDMQII